MWRSLVLVLAACGSTSSPSPITNQTPHVNDGAIALTVLFSGQEIWLGNDDFETDPNATYPGALHGLERGLAALSLPQGSTIAVVAYATGAHTVVARRPAHGFTGAELGVQKIYRNAIGSDLVQGVTTALGELEHADAMHKVLVVVGDGNDTNNDTAQAVLVDAARRAAAAHITLRAVVWKSAISADGEIIHSLTPDVKTVARSADLAHEIPAATAP